MKQDLPSISELNKLFRTLTPEKRLEKLYDYFDEEEVLMSSSFGTTSIYLIHLIHRVNPNQPIHVINTGYLFKETEEYMMNIKERYGLNLKIVGPTAADHQESVDKKLFDTNPDLCCTLNKVLPFEMAKSTHKVWITGLLSHQNDYRAELKIFEKSGQLMKFNPVIDSLTVDIKNYMDYFDLPAHPLEAQGYGSVGCTHCTSKGKGRSGRWQNSDKTECGLHLPHTIKM